MNTLMVTADDTPECRAAADEPGVDAFVAKQDIFDRLREATSNLFPEQAL